MKIRPTRSDDYDFDCPGQPSVPVIPAPVLPATSARKGFVPADITTTHERFFSGKLFKDFVIPEGGFASFGGALAPALGKKGDLPYPSQPKQKESDEAKSAKIRRARWLARRAEYIKIGIQRKQTRGEVEKPSKSTWLCGHGIIPSVGRKGSATGSPGQAQIHKYKNEDADGIGQSHSIVGVTRCASPHVCPTCSMGIQHKRRGQVEKASTYMLEHERAYVLITFTASHKFGDKLDWLIDAFQESQRLMRKNKDYKRWCQKWGYVHQIRSTETTLDHPDGTNKSGWHWHCHIVMYIDHLLTHAETELMREELAAMWTKACAKHGIKANSKHGVTIERPSYKKGEDKIFADAENVKRIASYVTKGVSLEVAPSPNSKIGRKGDRITTWQMMAMIVLDGRDDLIPLLNEYLTAVKGRRAFYMSRGLAEEVGLNEEEDVTRVNSEEETPGTDEEVLEGVAGEVVYAFDDERFHKLSWSGKTRALMHVLDSGATANKELIDSYLNGKIKSSILDEHKIEYETAGIEVFNAETGEVYQTNDEIIESYKTDLKPNLTVVKTPNVVSPELARKTMGVLGKLAPSKYKKAG